MRIAVEKTYTVAVGKYESVKYAFRLEIDSDEVEGGDDMEPEVLGAFVIHSLDNLAIPQLNALKATATRDSFIHNL